MDIHFSFSSFGVIQIANRYVLLVDKNRLEEKGEIVLTLPGGVCTIDPIVEKIFGDVRYLRKTPLPEQGANYPLTDLRFVAPEERADALCGIFESRNALQPETLVRKLREELVKRTRTLRRRDLYRFHHITHTHTVRERSATTRASGGHADTVQAMSFFDIGLVPRAAARLASMAYRRPLHQQIIARLTGRYAGAYVYLATRDEIAAGRTVSGTEIDSITNKMFVSGI